MTIHPKQILCVFAALISIASSVSLAQIQSSSAPAVTPIAASAQTVVPTLVPFSGLAIDREGRALSSETGITFLIFKDQNGGEPLFKETQQVVPDSAGHYSVHLGASMTNGIPVDLFGSGEARWLEVQIAGEPTQARTLLTSVPYALKAADAATLGGLPVSAFMRAPVSGSTASTASSINAGAGIAPAVTSTAVTTPGGTNGLIPVFTGASTIANTLLFYNTGGLGIGHFPAAPLDVLGKSIFRGAQVLSRAGDATASVGQPSFGLIMQSSVYNSNNKGALLPYFQLQSEPTGNNTTTTGATFNFLYYSGVGANPSETGLSFNSNGTINFAPGQTFPGSSGGGTGTGNPVCVATAGGFGSGGTTFVAPAFVVPAGGGCTAWSGFTKTASTVVLTTNGAGCVSTDAKKLTLSLSSADPDFLGVGKMGVDYIQLTRSGTTGSFTLSGTDAGQFAGSAAQVSCTASLLQLNENND